VIADLLADIIPDASDDQVDGPKKEESGIGEHDCDADDEEVGLEWYDEIEFLVESE
jgi:hypothetical protein